uniref:SFRICE023815.1 n=1 Tax=Spodoptera frugiperda TaxID=7108 RepID=A0A2H1W6C3_SPOFR
MSKANYGQFLRNTNLILPKQPNHDEFLIAMENVFRWSCLIGVLGAKKWICYVWSAFILVVLLVMESQAIWKVIKALGGWAIDTAGQRSVTARLAGTIFYTIAIISLILASKLFRSWGQLSAVWVRVERVMAVKVPSDGTLKRRMYLTVGFMTVCALLEHLLSIVSAIGLDCPPNLIMKRYILISHGFMILRHEYSDWFPIPLAFMSTIATMLWNFQDQLIVLISMGLTSRYSRLNQCLAKICALEKKQMDSDQKTEATKVYIWRKLREAYVKQAMLVRKVDDAIGGIIILSCFCNFYFICLQMFLGITQSKSSEPLRTVYYFTSLGWLCFRVIIVVLAASNINVHSQIALNHIYTHDTLYYNVEMGRLQDQLSKDYVALSGKGFFYLSKSILLQMAGAIITYELVLIQFDDKGTDDVQLNLTKNGIGVD